MKQKLFLKQPFIKFFAFPGSSKYGIDAFQSGLPTGILRH